MMDLQKKLDMLIKRAEAGEESLSFGYEVQGRTYNSYMTNDEWTRFKADMPEGVKKQYREGSGGELEEKNGRPPKMASYGSSSRMIYRLSKAIDGFCFEKKLNTAIGGTAHLDGFVEYDDRYVFVEAKCREPYSMSYPIELSRAYRELCEYINQNMSPSLECHLREHPTREGYMKACFSGDGEEIAYFDIKQMICHLLGIANALIRGELKQKQIDFLYLVYDPTELDCGEEIENIYGQLSQEAIGVDMNTLFVCILRYLREIGVGEMTDEEIDKYLFDFTFALCNQDFYPSLIG